jgi:hypothetical protein
MTPELMPKMTFGADAGTVAELKEGPSPTPSLEMMMALMLALILKLIQIKVW